MSDQEQRDREQQPVEVETEGHAWRGKYASETDETPGESKGDVEGHGLKEGDDPDAGKPPSDQSKDARLSDRKGTDEPPSDEETEGHGVSRNH